MKRIYHQLARLFLLLLPVMATANTNTEYSVAKYHIDIQANESNTFLVIITTCDNLTEGTDCKSAPAKQLSGVSSLRGGTTKQSYEYQKVVLQSE